MTHKMTNEEIREAYKKEGGPELDRQHSDDFLTSKEQLQMIINGVGVVICVILVVMLLQARPELWDALKGLFNGL